MHLYHRKDQIACTDAYCVKLITQININNYYKLVFEIDGFSHI